MKSKLKIIFVERGTCESCEQCTGRTQGNVDTDSNAFPNPLLV